MRNLRAQTKSLSQWLSVGVFGVTLAVVTFVAFVILSPHGDAGGDVDGFVLSPEGAPVADATVRLIFPSVTKLDTTDARGCFHVHVIHSPNDTRASFGVTKPGMKSWMGEAGGEYYYVATVKLAPLASPVASTGWFRPRTLSDSALIDCTLLKR